MFAGEDEKMELMSSHSLEEQYAEMTVFRFLPGAKDIQATL
jgi:hypothetical protein